MPPFNTKGVAVTLYMSPAEADAAIAALSPQIELYAELLVKKGVAIRPGQELVVQSPVECADFARMVVRKAYEARAGHVTVIWHDDVMTRLEYENVGLPYFDHLLEKKKNATIPNKSGKVILLAPSWGQSSFLYKFGERLIDGLVETGYEIVFRPHPQSFTADKELLDKIRARYTDRSNFIWNTDNDNFNILNRADLLISDFSDVVFDFALVFGKPIMYTPIDDFDGSMYDYVWANTLIWKFKVLPTIGCEISEDQIDDIKNRLDAVISSEEYKQGIKAARDFAWKNPGQSANAIVNYLTDLQLKVSDTAAVK